MKADEKIIGMLVSGRHCSVEKYGEKLKSTFMHEILHSLCVCASVCVCIWIQRALWGVFFLLNIISTFLNSMNPLYDIKLFDKKTIQSIQSSLWQMTVFQLPLLLLPFFQLL